MNIVELRTLVTACNGSIWWECGGVQLCASFDNASYINKPFILVDGKPVKCREFMSVANSWFIRLSGSMTLTQFKQLRFLLFQDPTYYEVDVNGELINLYEELRFQEEEISDIAEVVLIDKIYK